MDQAPSPDQIRQEAEANSKVSATRTPTVAVIGCGGFGINMLVRHLSAKHEYDDEISYAFIDTSRSNTHPAELDSVAKYVLAEDGAGKIRSTHHDLVQRQIDTCGVIENCRDINIIIFSTSGGTGSIVAPLLAAELVKNHNRNVILCCVIDDISKVECDNSIKTIKTMENLARINGHYYPVMMFTNCGIGRRPTNDVLPECLHATICMFTDKTVTELDWSDKMNFLRPHTIGCAEPGIYTFAIEQDHAAPGPKTGETCTDFDLSHEPSVHACINVDDNGMLMYNVMSNITYIGMSDVHKHFAIVGPPLSPSAFAALNRKAEKFNKVNTVRGSEVSGAFTDHSTPKGPDTIL